MDFHIPWILNVPPPRIRIVLKRYRFPIYHGFDPMDLHNSMDSQCGRFGIRSAFERV